MGADARYDEQGDISLRIYDTPDIVETSPTSVRISVATTNMTVNPTKYEVTYYFLNPLTGVIEGSATTNDYFGQPFQINGLVAGGNYLFYIKAYNGAVSGNTVSVRYKFNVYTPWAGYFAAPYDPTKAQASKSFMRLSNNATKDPKKYTLARRAFPGLAMPTSTPKAYKFSELSNAQTGATYSKKFYAFGTTLYFDSIVDKAKQSAGFGFFVGNDGKRGYYILVDTTETAASVNKKEIRIVRVRGGDMRRLSDSQRNTVSSFNGVYGGRSYQIDVKVQINGESIKINAYINGFKITATDTTSIFEDEDGKNKFSPILEPTTSVAAVCKNGEAYFDYVYATEITEAQYKNSEYVTNIYQGVFSNDYLNLGFGNIIYNQAIENDQQANPENLDEFGTTVREIKKNTIRWDNTPAYPIKFSSGANKSVKILGQKLSNFGGEVYVLNNSSALTPLNDQGAASFFIYGDTLSPSGQLEYVTDEIPEYQSQEPVIFESAWLQNLSDVESLGQWIKTNIVNTGKIVEMNVFGNPLLSVGDIITIKNSYQGLAGTEKFIVTEVRHSFSEGLETSIVCRTL